MIRFTLQVYMIEGNSQIDPRESCILNVDDYYRGATLAQSSCGR